MNKLTNKLIISRPSYKECCINNESNIIDSQLIIKNKCFHQPLIMINLNKIFFKN